VSTPCLTGVGERIHLSSPLVGLGTHIRDVVNHVLYEDLDEIVLVGFSYGGFVVTGALEHIAERFRTWSISMHLSQATARRFGRISAARPVPGSNSVRIGLSLVLCVNLIVLRKRTGWQRGGQLNRKAASRSRFFFHDPGVISFTRTYIKATQAPKTMFGNEAFWRAARHAKGSPAWRYHEIATNHMVANNRPDELARILADIA